MHLFKKGVVYSLFLCLLVVLIGCVKDGDKMPSKTEGTTTKEVTTQPKPTYPTAPNDMVFKNEDHEKAYVLTMMIQDTYWSKTSLRYFDKLEIGKPMATGTAFLWSYGAALTNLATLARVNPEETEIVDALNLTVKQLKIYKTQRQMRSYSASTNGDDDIYYDDNAWVVLGLFDAAKATNNSDYMEQSRELLDFVLSGESEDGGIFWHVNHKSRNVCSIGPAIVGALLHYQESGDETLLETAKRLYHWTHDNLMDPADGRYWDNIEIKEDGHEEINQTKWTYNTGTMIWAGSLLYEVTGDEQYKEQALASALGAYRWFPQILRNIRFYPSSPWFNLYLVRGFVEVARVTGDTTYIDSIKENLDYAWENARDKRGFIYTDWRGAPSTTSGWREITMLEQAGTAESYALLAYYNYYIEPNLSK